jgi:hypothetical protein
MDPIDDGWRVPGGFPEDHAQRHSDLQIALTELTVAVRAHLAELRRRSDASPHAQESRRLAVTFTAGQIEAKLATLEREYAHFLEHRRLVGRALVRCETYDLRNSQAGQSDASR